MSISIGKNIGEEGLETPAYSPYFYTSRWAEISAAEQ